MQSENVKTKSNSAAPAGNSDSNSDSGLFPAGRGSGGDANASPAGFVASEPAWLVALRSKAAAAFADAAWPTLADEEWRRTDISKLPLDEIPQAAIDYGQAGSGGSSAAAGTANGNPAASATAGYLCFRDGLAVSDPALAGSATGPAGPGGTTAAGSDGSAASLPAGSAASGTANGATASPANTAGSGGGTASAITKTPTFANLSNFLLQEEAQDTAWAPSKALQSAFQTALESADNKVALWALARADHGVFIYIPAGQRVDKPYRIDFEYEGEDIAHFPFVAIVAEAGAEASVELSWNAKRGSLVNAGIAAILGANARVHLSQIEKSSKEAVIFSNTRCLLERDSYLKHFEAILGGGLVKHRIDSSLMGPGSDLVLNGVSFTSDEQHIDLRTVQHHHAHHATSNTVYRGAVADESRSIYQGMIEVGTKATGTDAYLSNKNLVLHDGARADSIPCLQINTDDVRCSHGSTTGKIRQDQIFFLMSRGFSRRQAQQELILAYYHEVIAQEREELQEELALILEPQIQALADVQQDAQLGVQRRAPR